MNDTADQLKWFSEAVGGGLGGLFQFGYDNAGNQLVNLNGSFTYNNVNQITNTGYSYDNNGSLTTDPFCAYEWDAANRLIAINYPAVPSMRSEFTYDGLGRRVKIVEKGLGAPSITFNFTPASKQYAVFPSSSPPVYSLAAGNYTLTISGLNPETGNSVGLVDAIKFNGTIINNGSFETPAITGGTSVVNPSGATPWSFTLTSGISKNNSPYMGTVVAPDVRQVGFVKNSGTISQTMTLTAGNYALKLSAAQASGNTTPQAMQATLQGLAQVVTSTKQFIWNRNVLAEERDAGNVITRRFYPQGEQIGGTNYFYTRDHLGSIREFLDTAGAIRARYDYDPFGGRSKLSGNLEAAFGYTGHYYHQPSGLLLSLYRAYDASSARWLSRDPLGEAAGANFYAYVRNDSLNLSDPLGLVDVPAHIPMTPNQVALAKAAFGPGGQSININQQVLNTAPLRDLGVLAHNSERGILTANSPSTLNTQTMRLAATNAAIDGRTQSWGPLSALGPTAAYYLAVGNAPIGTAFSLAPLGSSAALGVSGIAGWELGRLFMELPLADGQNLDEAWTDIFQQYFWDWWYDNKCP